MLESGIVIFLAFWLLWIKLPITTRLRALGRPFLLDLSVSVGVWLMFGGTGEGLLAASFAALIMSVNISLARKAFGHMTKEGDYVVGWINQTSKIIEYKRRKLYARKAQSALDC